MDVAINATPYKEYNMQHWGLSEAEKNFDNTAFMDWMHNNWTLSFYAAAVYLVVIFSLKRFMENRTRFELTGLLFVWNFMLAAFSIYGAVKALPELLYVLREFGFEYSICDNTAIKVDKPIAMWCYLYSMSKIVELGDTVFIVLRKQPLIFLHWYHHITVLWNVWYSAAHQLAVARWFGIVNIVVHAVMYSYYTLKSLKVRIPVKISMAITSFQLVQMVVGCYATYSVFKVIEKGGICDARMDHVYGSIVMYSSYFILFAYFFWDAYVSGKPLKTRLKLQ